MSTTRAYFDDLRTLAYTGISGTYAAVGSATTIQPRIVCITNDTNAGMIFSDDNTVSVGKLYLPAGSFKLFDVTANFRAGSDDDFILPIGLTMYVKQSTAPTSGAVYVEYIYGNA